MQISDSLEPSTRFVHVEEEFLRVLCALRMTSRRELTDGSLINDRVFNLGYLITEISTRLGAAQAYSADRSGEGVAVGIDSG